MENFTTFDNFAFYLALASTLFLTGQFLLSSLGLYDDHNVDTHADSSFRVFTINNLLGFTMCLGWTALSMHLEFNLSEVWSGLIGVGTGSVFVFIQTSILYAMYKLNAPNLQTLNTAIGQTGKVYQEIPDCGIGKITLVLNNTASVIKATSMYDDSISYGSDVVVTGVNNDILVVKKVEKENQ